MKATLLLLLLACSLAVAEDNIIFTNRIATFTNLEGRVYQAVELVRGDVDGLIWRDEHGSGGRLSYTNLAPELLTTLGIPVERISMAKERAQRKTAAPTSAVTTQSQEPARPTAETYLMIHALSAHIWFPSDYDFPKNEKEKQGCKEILSELKQMRKALDLGIAYSGFSELLQQKALAIEKLKDDYPNLPRSFVRAADSCVQNWSDAKRNWQQKIKVESMIGTGSYQEYMLHCAILRADVPFYSCKAMAESSPDTNAVLEAEADLILFEQAHPEKERRIPILLMDKQQLVTQMKAAIDSRRTKANDESNESKQP